MCVVVSQQSRFYTKEEDFPVKNMMVHLCYLYHCEDVHPQIIIFPENILLLAKQQEGWEGGSSILTKPLLQRLAFIPSKIENNSHTAHMFQC